MPRKTTRWGADMRADSCFNEAAARCHGKHEGPHVGRRLPGASMRPRPDATENDRARTAGAAERGASMRPRPDATENTVLQTGPVAVHELQ